MDKLSKKVEELREFNPMLGHRGCRLAVTYPEIAEMQAEAIMTAAIEVHREDGIEIVPEIMIPLVGLEKELKIVKDVVVKTIEKIFEREGIKLDYQIGTMIEIPRAALTADEIAKEAEFFSFGTNDLTQMTFGFSRDDTGVIIREYVDRQIFEKDPFQTLDKDGVGQLVEMAVKKGKKTRSNIKLGICGEHGGDPETVEYHLPRFERRGEVPFHRALRRGLGGTDAPRRHIADSGTAPCPGRLSEPAFGSSFQKGIDSSWRNMRTRPPTRA